MKLTTMFVALATMALCQLSVSLAPAQGFLGHEVSLYGKNYSNKGERSEITPFLIGTAVVGSGEEFGSTTKVHSQGVGTSPPTDISAFTIEIDQSAILNTRGNPGNFNGLVFEDTNGTLPDFLSVTYDPDVALKSPAQIIVSPNSIWLNSADLVTKDAFVRLLVTFADTPPSPPSASLTATAPDGMILEAPTTVGALYQFEQSNDLIAFTPIDTPFTAVTTFRTRFLNPMTTQQHYRLRMLSEPQIPLHADFESGAAGWNAESNTPNQTQWELGTPRAEGIDNKAASGMMAWGTNLHDNYGPDISATLRSPLVDLSQHNLEAALTFRYMIDTPDAEGGQVRMVDESGKVIHDYEIPFTGKTSTWTPFRLVLPEALQNMRFRIEFRFLSDSDEEVGAGWFIDDVVVL